MRVMGALLEGDTTPLAAELVESRGVVSFGESAVWKRQIDRHKWMKIVMRCLVKMFTSCRFKCSVIVILRATSEEELCRNGCQ